MSSSQGRSTKTVYAILFLFVFFWTVMTLACVFFVTRGAVRQADAALRFHSTSGTIVSSTIEERSGDSGPNYEPVVKYSYRVNGTDYASDRVTFGGTWSGSKSSATREMRKYPNNSAVPVFYDPADPATSVLRTGVQPDQIILWVGIVTPFSTFMLFMWYAAWKYGWQTRNLPGGFGLRMILVSDDGDRLRLGVTRHAPGFKAGLALAIISLVLACIVLFRYGSDVSMPMALGSFAAAYGSALAIYVVLRRLNATGNYDVVMDRSNGNTQVGAWVVRAGAGIYSFEETSAVGIASRMDGDESPTEVFDVVLFFTGEVEPNPVPIGRTLSRSDAEVLRDWLCSEFGWNSE